MAKIKEINELNMILVAEWNGGMNTTEICKRYDVQRWRVATQEELDKFSKLLFL